MSAAKFTSGINRQIDQPDEYFKLTGGKRGEADFVLSRSDLWDFNFCPQAFRQGPRYVNKDSPGIVKGSLLDVLLLRPNWFEELYVVSKYDAFRSKESKEWRQEQWDKGKDVIKEKDLDEVRVSADRIKWLGVSGGATLFQILENSKTQVMLTHLHKDKATGIEIPLKCLLDIVPNGGETLMDLKGSAWPEPSKFPWQMLKYGLDFQAGFYAQMFEWVTGTLRPMWLWPVVGNQRPWLPAHYCLDVRTVLPRQRFSALEKFNNALADYAGALDSGKWPGLTEGWANVAYLLDR